MLGEGRLSRGIARTHGTIAFQLGGIERLPGGISRGLRHDHGAPRGLVLRLRRLARDLDALRLFRAASVVLEDTRPTTPLPTERFAVLLRREPGPSLIESPRGVLPETVDKRGLVPEIDEKRRRLLLARISERGEFGTVSFRGLPRGSLFPQHPIEVAVPLPCLLRNGRLGGDPRMLSLQYVALRAQLSAIFIGEDLLFRQPFGDLREIDLRLLAPSEGRDGQLAVQLRAGHALEQFRPVAIGGLQESSKVALCQERRPAELVE